MLWNCIIFTGVFSCSDQEAILNSLRVDIPMKFDFLFAKTHAEVISGRQEGVYLWIAINHALGKFDDTLGGKVIFVCLLFHKL